MQAAPAAGARRLPKGPFPRAPSQSLFPKGPFPSAPSQRPLPKGTLVASQGGRGAPGCAEPVTLERSPGG